MRHLVDDEAPSTDRDHDCLTRNVFFSCYFSALLLKSARTAFGIDLQVGRSDHTSLPQCPAPLKGVGLVHHFIFIFMALSWRFGHLFLMPFFLILVLN